MRKLLSTVAAVLLAGGLSYSASIPYLTGPYDPGNATGTLNQVIANTVFGVEGLLGYVNGPIGSVGTTVQAFATTIVPTGQLLTGGQGLRATCSGSASTNLDQKIVWLTIGNAGEVTPNNVATPIGFLTGTPGVVVSSGAFGTSTSTAWTIQARIFTGNPTATLGSAATPNSFDGQILIQNTTASQNVFVFAGGDTIDNIATGLVVQCGYEAGTKADVTMQTFAVEQIK